MVSARSERFKGGIMASKAVLYVSSLGKTRKIANYIAKGLNADVFDLKKQRSVDISKYDHIIFGTGIHAGRPYGALVDFLTENKDRMSGKKTSLFLSCMYDGEKGETQLKNVSSELGINDAFFFHGKGEKNGEKMERSVDIFIEEMRKR